MVRDVLSHLWMECLAEWILRRRIAMAHAETALHRVSSVRSLNCVCPELFLLFAACCCERCSRSLRKDGLQMGKDVVVAA